jgi:hypothetical protein
MHMRLSALNHHSRNKIFTQLYLLAGKMLSEHLYYSQLDHHGGLLLLLLTFSYFAANCSVVIKQLWHKAFVFLSAEVSRGGWTITKRQEKSVVLF